MTEAEWLVSTDSLGMLAFLSGQISDRKLHLTAYAFLRRFWHLIPDQRSRRAIEVREQYADGRASLRLLQRARKEAARAFDRLLSEERDKGAVQTSFYTGCLSVAWHAAGWDEKLRPPWEPKDRSNRPRPLLGMMAWGAIPMTYAPGDDTWFLRCTPTDWEGRRAAVTKEKATQANLLRDLFGNPFRRVAVAPSCLAWQGGSIVRLARAVYEDRAYDGMPVLGDALEEAGCADSTLLDHCRTPGHHVRGCWLLDLLLGQA
jgi:hypothetical protein